MMRNANQVPSNVICLQHNRCEMQYDAVKISDVNYRADTDGQEEKGWSHDGSLKGEGNDSRKKTPLVHRTRRRESTCKLVSNAS